ncbi:DNA mismatch repair endonuclease MutL [Flavisolibacter tropicus]|uniref:DNA mismatch repair protein MutL n=1 Tax=Flavisolibacter tropicus TaxID=1492898 RepID=A0A172TYE0_9BACT|nr:DNA mismatch repair endonuclease MutL [Flavisolibacter tropicus]ANE52026.1 DNA mismatch repair protein MutL [Flavisolibacter tropicus]
MADRIQLLPDNIANQIAAGEVIQRPASAVKELLENAVDAGATEIKLLVNDAGKALIQVIDNGVGMSETDARMCFERHATSKIQNINDLFHIRTMGFRGEALASIAAVAQVEMRTKRDQDEAGTCIEIENSVVVKQSPVAMVTGTSIAMKNLFFNVPARRNFLKSNPVELRHIVDEFIRVALAFPHIFFSLTNNGQQLFHLDAGSLKQRITQILGSGYAAKVVPVKEETDYLNIHGFIGKPETAKKTRGDQYFFVNNRFIKSPYLNHAVMSAYQDMIPADSFPMYVLFIDLDPAQVDVNVHPTKQEIKFEDEKIVYAFVQAAVKHALAQFSITPSLEFDLDASIQGLDAVQKPFTDDNKAAAQSSSIFQAFTEANQAHRIEPSNSSSSNSSFRSLGSYIRPQEDDLFEQPTIATASFPSFPAPTETPTSFVSLAAQHGLFSAPEEVKLTQLFNTYVMVPNADHFLLVHQQAAHERVLYERLLQALDQQSLPTQQSLFPATIDVTPTDAVILQELLPYFQKMGYSIEPFGKTTFVIQGTPADMESGNEKIVIERILEQYKHFSSELKLSNREKLLRSVAWQQAVKPGKILTQVEMQALVSDLFNCSMPNAAPNGRPTYTTFRRDQIDKLF